MKIIHLSDLQLPYIKENTLNQVVEYINRQLFDVLICTGDIVQRSRLENYHSAKEFLDKLDVKYKIFTPGNHDISFSKIFPRILYPYSYFKQFFPHSIDGSYVVGDVAIYTLNTSRLYLSVKGSVSINQLEECEKFFQENEDKIKILLSHHPLYEHSNLQTYGLNKINSFFKNVKPDLILSGHMHCQKIFKRKFSKMNDETSIFLQCGTLSTRTRNCGNSFYQLNLNGHKKIDIRECIVKDSGVEVIKK